MKKSIRNYLCYIIINVSVLLLIPDISTDVESIKLWIIDPENMPIMLASARYIAVVIIVITALIISIKLKTKNA